MVPNNVMANAPEIQIEAIQTVPPYKVTDPRDIRQVLVMDPIKWDIFQGCLNVVLYYEHGRWENSGWKVAGWFKDSLGRAVVEEPLISGRLRRGEDSNGELEIVANDSGIRLVEAKICITLQDFLRLKERENLEAQLVLWKEVDDQSPQFCPLFYVQVTNFKCGGYSVGVSCSLLLADLLIDGNFLQRWADIHNNLVPETDELKLPIFYLPNLKANGSSPTSTICATPVRNRGQTMVFKIAGESNVSLKTFALLSIKDAESKLGSTMSSNFPLIVKETPEVLVIQTCEKNKNFKSQKNLISQVTISRWDDFGVLQEISFLEGNKPSTVSYWIAAPTKGLAMAIPSTDENASGLTIVVSIPQVNEI